MARVDIRNLKKVFPAPQKGGDPVVAIEDISLEVDGNLPVREGHRIAHEVKDALLAANLSVLDALVHIEPAGGVRQT